MAYIVTTETTLSDGAINNVDISMPVGHQIGDMTVLMITQDGGGTTISTPTGFTQIGTQGASQAQRTTAFFRIHTAVDEADVNITGTNDEWIVTAVLIRGATTLSVHQNNRTNSADSSTNFLTSGTVTTTVANCLVLSCFGFDGVFKLALDNTSLNKSVNLSKEINVGAVQICQYFNQITAGATDTLTALSEVSSEGGSALIIAIAEATPATALMSPMITQAYQVLKRYGGISTAADTVAAFIRHDGVTWEDANGTITPTAIKGLNLATIATFAEAAFQGTLSTWGSMTGLSHTGSAIDNTGRWYGRTHTIAQTNLTNKIFSIEFMMSEVATGRLGAEGGLVYFQDSSGNWAAFQLSRRQRLVAAVSYVYFVDVEKATPYDKSTTNIDWTDVVRLAYLIHKRTTATNAVILRIKNAILLDKVIMVDGSSASPCNPTFLERILGGLDPIATGGHGAYIFNTVQGKGQSLARFGVQYGDGARKTYYDTSATSLELPLRADGSLAKRFWQVPDYSSAGKVQIKTSASDIVKQNACVIATDTEQDYIIDPTSSTSATYDFAGSSIIGWRVAHNVSGITINNATLQNCRITLNGGSLSGCIISNSKAPVVTNNPGKISNTNFVSPGTGYAITITATGTYDFTGNTFTGYGANGTANAMIYNNSGGLVTLILPAGSQEPTITNGVDASTVIELPQVYQSVTISGGVDDTRVQIYDTLNDEELVNEIVDSFPFTWTDSVPYIADRTIRVRTMFVSGVTAKIFTEQNLGTLTNASPSVNYLLEQKDDVVYETNNIDGSTVTEVVIDDALLLVKIDTGQLSWGTIYAYETYWLYTEEGIRDEGRFIEAIDPANYKVYGFKVKNVTSPSIPLELIGGWAVDGTTGKSIDIIDNTGGTLFSAPEHVVAYATSGGGGGSGITAADVWNYSTKRLSSVGVNDIVSPLKGVDNRDLTEVYDNSGGGSGGGDSKEDIYGYFTTGSRQDAFKANVSGLATQASVDGKPTLAQIEASTVIAKEATLSPKASQASVDAIPTTPLLAANYTAPDNAGIAAIKTKTDNLPVDPASNTQVNTRLASEDYTVPDNTSIGQIKTKVDTLNNTDLTGIATSLEVIEIENLTNQIYKITGLDKDNPLVITKTDISAGDIAIKITGTEGELSTLTRQ